MRLRSLIAGSTLLAAAAAGLVTAPTATAAAPADTPTVEAELAKDVKSGEKVRAIVQVDPNQNVPSVATSAERASATTDVLPQPQSRTFFVMEVDKKTLEHLKKDARVDNIFEDKISKPSLTNSLKVIGGDKVQQRGWTGTGYDVAILDTGIDRDHPFFAGRIVAEACFSSTDAERGSTSLCPNGTGTQQGEAAADAETPKCLAGGENICYHGSHVAGIAAGKKPAAGNTPGNGVAPGAGIIAVQVFSRFETGCPAGQTACVGSWTSDQLRALDYVAGIAASGKVAAVNMSLGSPETFPQCDTFGGVELMKAAFNKLLTLGTAPVVAAGNSYSPDEVSFPACLSSAVTVGATNNADEVAGFSNRGSELDLFAPGVDIQSAVPNNTWEGLGGTSMAAPHVAGAFALLKEANPGASAAELLQKLESTGKTIRYDSYRTPRINLARAIPNSKPSPSPTTSPTASPTGSPTASPTGSPTASPTGSPTQSPTASPTPTATTSPSPTPSPTYSEGPKHIGTDPAPVPSVCKRGNGVKPLTAATWAREFAKGTRTFTDRTLLCSLTLAEHKSKVFTEVVKTGSLSRAYRVLKPSSTSAKAALDRELLAAWLNWAHGVHETGDRVSGSTTLSKALASAERARLKGASTAAQLRKSATFLGKNVNK
ncbi:S8 family peptidase [Sinosporangium siamense]|uniref:Peptidase S8/S53 domain-containing protein n=1 Tax=Sinosporangium siamense TaxID=1367973 RepID=A0A919RFS5_9ACTN|nr:S8 family serine peptidase [Sinosporangium siamense]GII92577.1 hypothetical protein Ssi02_28080 [Sinosporangium siamense]